MTTYEGICLFSTYLQSSLREYIYERAKKKKLETLFLGFELKKWVSVGIRKTADDRTIDF